MKRLIFGCGYLGARVGRLWLDAGDEVVVVTRSEERSQTLAEEGFTPAIADVTHAESLAEHTQRFDSPDTILYAVGYDRTAEPPIQEVYAGGLLNVSHAIDGPTPRFIYISSTGVYGGADGDWVDERTPPAPQRPGGLASLAAEQALRASQFAEQGVALRLAGIYGPGRVPYLTALQAGEPIAAPCEGHVNLIHVDDAARVVVAAAAAEGPLPTTLCVSDGSPPIRGVYYGEVARLIGAAPPTFVDPPEDSPRAARAAADKKVRNDLMKQTLDYSLHYPDYRAGLAAILGKAGHAG